jgi:DNA-binding FrmR family transcriptional regulator
MNECCNRRTERSDELRGRLLNRLKRIEGQIRGIEGMLAEDAYCPDILIQVSAVSAALSSFSAELLKRHIESCVKEDIKRGREGTAEELSVLISKLMR